jgi:hypothetical protein
VRRVFWVSVGAAAGYYAARRAPVLIEEARARGVVGNVTLAAATASKAASAASRATAAVGDAVGSRTRAAADADVTADHRTVDTRPAAPPTTPSSREVRP